jgi:hypothetical protein
LWKCQGQGVIFWSERAEDGVSQHSLFWKWAHPSPPLVSYGLSSSPSKTPNGSIHFLIEMKDKRFGWGLSRTKSWERKWRGYERFVQWQWAVWARGRRKNMANSGGELRWLGGLFTGKPARQSGEDESWRHFVGESKMPGSHNWRMSGANHHPFIAAAISTMTRAKPNQERTRPHQRTKRIRNSTTQG